MKNHVGTYHVGIDLGTTWTAAATCKADGSVELVPLGDRSAAVPSVVLVDEDGVFTIGEAAERRAHADPSRMVREFKRRIGDRVPIVVDGVATAPEELAARFVERVLKHVAEREGGPPDRIALTHPAGWGPHKLGSLQAALDALGLPPVLLLPEPRAAAIGYASTARVEPGTVVAVYDFGGGTFDAALARKLPDGGFELLGQPEGIEQLGGVDLDDLVFEHVRAALGPAWDGLDVTDPDVLAAITALRVECTLAKESLSSDTEVVIPVALPGVHTGVRLSRDTFEELIRPAVAETVAALRHAVASAGLPEGAMPRVLLVGGSSRIPLVAQLLSADLGRPVAVDVDPKAVVASGAAVAARQVGLTPPRLPPRAPAAGLGPPPVGPPQAPTAPSRPVAPPPPAPAMPAGPSSVRPFREEEQRPGRLRVVVGIAAAVVVTAIVVVSLVSAILRTGSFAPEVSPANASTPSTQQGPPPPTTNPTPPTPRPAAPPQQQGGRATQAPPATTTRAAAQNGGQQGNGGQNQNDGNGQGQQQNGGQNDGQQGNGGQQAGGGQQGNGGAQNSTAQDPNVQDPNAQDPNTQNPTGQNQNGAAQGTQAGNAG